MPTTEMTRAARFRIFTLVSLPFIILALTTPCSFAQSEVSGFDPYPLRPANTSSPRDTLRSFNAAVNQGAQAFQSRQPHEVVTTALERAVETLDLSELPELERRAKVVETVLYLKE